MKIDLNDGNQFTLDGVRRLIASCDDSENRQLCVSMGGVARICKTGEPWNDVSFKLASWGAGMDYCGVDASLDDEWVSIVYFSLKANWPKPVSKVIDFYLSSWEK
jgi:hypothetical protein